MSHQFKDMHAMIISNNTVAMLICHKEALFLEFIAVAKAYEAPLCKSKVADLIQIVFQLKCEVIFLVSIEFKLIKVFIFICCPLSLNHILEGSRLLYSR